MKVNGLYHVTKRGWKIPMPISNPYMNRMFPTQSRCICLLLKTTIWQNRVKMMLGDLTPKTNFYPDQVSSFDFGRNMTHRSIV